MENNALFRKVQGSMNERITEFFGKDISHRSVLNSDFRPVMEEHFILRRYISKDSDPEREKKEYIETLDKMVFMVAHTLRQPITNILGIANYFKESEDLPEETNRVVEYLHDSALHLDIVSREMTKFINLLTQKVKTKD